MFRKIRRVKNEISIEDAKNLLTNNKRGVLSLNGDGGYPYAFPINFYYEKSENKIYFHGAKKGHKIDSMLDNPKACFTTYDDGILSEDGWSYYVSSAVVFGKMELVDDEKIALEKVRKLSAKYYPNAQLIDDAVKESFAAVQIFALNIEHISGKRVNER